MSCDSAALDSIHFPFTSATQSRSTSLHFTYLRRTQKHLIEKVLHHLLPRWTQVAAWTRLAGCACSHKVCEGPQQLVRSNMSTGSHVRRDSEIYLGVEDQGCSETFQPSMVASYNRPIGVQEVYTFRRIRSATTANSFASTASQPNIRNFHHPRGCFGCVSGSLYVFCTASQLFCHPASIKQSPVCSCIYVSLLPSFPSSPSPSCSFHQDQHNSGTEITHRHDHRPFVNRIYTTACLPYQLHHHTSLFPRYGRHS